jgi:HNH endonuclease
LTRRPFESRPVGLVTGRMSARERHSTSVDPPTSNAPTSDQAAKATPPGAAQFSSSRPGAAQRARVYGSSGRAMPRRFRRGPSSRIRQFHSCINEGAGSVSLRQAKQAKREQRRRWEALRRAPMGPERIGLLIRFAAPTPRDRQVSIEALRRRRQGFNQMRDGWLGDAGGGQCFGCGRHWRERCWHHIKPLMVGGSNGWKNRVPICTECHAQIHPWLPVPDATNEQLYRLARQPQALGPPRLVKKVEGPNG